MRVQWVFFALALIPFTSARQEQSRRPTEQATRTRYLELCARCHGELGDGRGETELPRPARSFLDGGFSYGNTHAAILRSISTGIPGTAMPAHRDAMSPSELEAMADYVISLGPPRAEVVPADTVLEVDDRALVVRGFLPALVEGGPRYPRGILIGTTTGATFQYRADDLRLLAVRQGAFVDRKDWRERGGNPLEPLGAAVLACEAGNPGPMFYLRRRDGTEVEDTPLLAGLRGTWAMGESAGIVYQLAELSGRPVAMVREEPRALSTGGGAGVTRKLQITALGRAATILLEAPYLRGDAVRAGPVWRASRADSSARVMSHEQTDGLFLQALLRGAPEVELLDDRVLVVLEMDRTTTFELGVVTTVDGSQETLRRLAEEAR